MTRSIGPCICGMTLLVLASACVGGSRSPAPVSPRPAPIVAAGPSAAAQASPDPETGGGPSTAPGQVATEAEIQGSGQLRYTTFFYTAAEAVVQGYEPDTSARIVSIESGATVWSGTLGPGDATLVSTGRGVFSFISDRKAAILVGTPSSCTVVGYWARDEDGGFVSDHFFVRLPASTTYGDDERVVVWAWQDTQVRVRDLTTGNTLFDGAIGPQGRHEIRGAALASMGSHVLDVRADRPVVAVQVYYDEGFGVPASTGRGSGTDFLTYLGRITEGVNDLVVVSYSRDAHVTVEDIGAQETLFDGTVAAGSARTLTLHERFLRIRSDVEVSVLVAPFEHYGAGYAEHHYSAGAEGTGIDNDFIVTTPGELWIFSYFDGNQVRVEDMGTGRTIWRGPLQAGHVQGLTPGHGIFRVRATAGTSVMGGSESCGGEYSPAARLFRVDEAVAQAVVQIQQARREEAAARGETLTAAEAAAPLTTSELQQATQAVQAATGSRVFDAEQVRQRVDAIRESR